MREAVATTRTAPSRGFTLVEGLLAGVILAAGALAIATGVTGSLRASNAGRDFQVAAELLDATMTRIDLIGPDRLLREGPLSGRFDPPHEQFEWSATIQLDPVLPDLYDVEVTLAWIGPRGERTATVATRLYDPMNSRNALLMWEDL